MKIELLNVRIYLSKNTVTVDSTTRWHRRRILTGFDSRSIHNSVL